MYYTIRHITRFRYSAPISESIMEVRIQPRTEGTQHCLDFRLTTTPRARILDYRGEQGNKVHHFDVPNRHAQLTINAHSLVELIPPAEPPEALEPSAWEELDALTADDEYWDSLVPSHFASPTELLYALAKELNVQRRDDPLTVLREINTGLHNSIEYSPEITTVDSPIDDALTVRRGVCQDFAHIMITLVRTLGIPCRYVSGYLFHQGGYRDRSSESATHAWVEALLPWQEDAIFVLLSDVIMLTYHQHVVSFEATRKANLPLPLKYRFPMCYLADMKRLQCRRRRKKSGFPLLRQAMNNRNHCLSSNNLSNNSKCRDRFLVY